MKITKNKNRDAQKKRTSHKAVESVLRPEGSLWWERFLKKVGLEPGVKERGSYRWREWGVDRVRRCGRRMNREVRDRGTGMRLTERTRKLIPDSLMGGATRRLVLSDHKARRPGRSATATRGPDVASRCREAL